MRVFYWNKVDGKPVKRLDEGILGRITLIQGTYQNVGSFLVYLNGLKNYPHLEHRESNSIRFASSLDIWPIEQLLIPLRLLSSRFQPGGRFRSSPGRITFKNPQQCGFFIGMSRPEKS